MTAETPANATSPAAREQAVAEFDKRLPKAPKMRRGFTVAPYLYPRLLHQVADLIDALNALEVDDPHRAENKHFAACGPIPIYNQDAYDDRDQKNTIVGWVWAVDAGAWTFVPFVPEIELDRPR